jgi:hypothetical protein
MAGLVGLEVRAVEVMPVLLPVLLVLMGRLIQEAVAVEVALPAHTPLMLAALAALESSSFVI